MTVSAPDREFLGCRVGGDALAIPVDRVQEVFETRQVTRVPGCPEVVTGLFNMRGGVVPVLNPWNLPAEPGRIKRVVVLGTPEGPVGILISALLDIVRFTESLPGTGLPKGLSATPGCFDGAALSGEPHHLLNVDRFIDGISGSVGTKEN